MLEDSPPWRVEQLWDIPTCVFNLPAASAWAGSRPNDKQHRFPFPGKTVPNIEHKITRPRGKCIPLGTPYFPLDTGGRRNFVCHNWGVAKR